MTVRILLADDHPVVRAGLRALIQSEPDLAVVAEAAEGEEAVRLTATVAPDIVILDLVMPGLDGIEATRRIVDLQSGAAVLVLTASEETSLVGAAVRAGAMGYVIKRVAEAELIQAIRAISHGDLYVHSYTGPASPNASSTPLVAPSPPADTLTPREIAVLRLIALGYTNPDMAEELQISVRTVESHRANLMDKLHLHSRIELVRYVRQTGLLELGQTP